MQRILPLLLLLGCGRTRGPNGDRTQVTEYGSASGAFGEYARSGSLCTCNVEEVGDGVEVQFSCTHPSMNDLLEYEVLYVTLPTYNVEAVELAEIQISGSDWLLSGFGVGTARAEVQSAVDLPDAVSGLAHAFFLHELVAEPQVIQSADGLDSHDFEGGTIRGLTMWCDRSALNDR
ncbi:MAG: hypothetical protein H6734_23920 [Alphaproteobacteria bacterium]|nr:hypothetical protein [Alphaproteobacteria bacterium]